MRQGRHDAVRRLRRWGADAEANRENSKQNCWLHLPHRICETRGEPALFRSMARFNFVFDDHMRTAVRLVRS